MPGALAKNRSGRKGKWKNGKQIQGQDLCMSLVEKEEVDVKVDVDVDVAYHVVGVC